MSDNNGSDWIEVAIKAIAAGGAEVLLAPLGLPGLATVGGVIIEEVVLKRRRIGHEFAGVISMHVGEEQLSRIVKADDERSEMLWSGVQAAMATGVEGKRILMARVVANAMTSDEPIDEAQLMLWALKELEAPHLRALARIRKADEENQDNPGLRDDILQVALRAEPYPVLAALARTGVVRQGSEQRGNGLFSATYAETFSISGISDFGLKLLADLESVHTDI